ncbi:ankyrin repeat domain-containing protein [Endozoicomonas sp. ONNA2]|uniref:ankyrin repeat domain-containing protein n=1 Tax=Endozoicomonas sp. ONNA2 TaxID=2828741 RepID=UPI0021474050|nr:ankyrin repeat domain-containing protein [Endozoicomonas sp. ONNA2]
MNNLSFGNVNKAFDYLALNDDQPDPVKSECSYLPDPKQNPKSINDKPLEKRLCTHCELSALPHADTPGHKSDRFGHIPILKAVCKGQTKILQSLLQNAPDAVNTKFNFPELGRDITLLYAAVAFRQPSAVKVLLQFGADANALCQPSWTGSSHYSTPLMATIDINCQKKAQIEVVDMLIKQGANVNAIKSESGRMLTWPPLTVAAYAKDIKTVELLVNRGADVDACFSDSDIDKINGCTPLMMAASCGHTRVVQYLLKKGANVNAGQYNAGEQNGRTAMTLAAMSNHTEVGKTLMEYGADVNVAMSNAGVEEGCTPVIAAASRGNRQFVQFLLENNADVNATMSSGAKKGWTALLCASCNGCKSITKLLLDHGANINAAESDEGAAKGRTPYMAASENGFKGVAKLLRERGAKLPPQQITPQSDFQTIMNSQPCDAVEGLVD